MAMYALATKPLIRKLRSDVPSINQVWYADEAASAGICEDLRELVLEQPTGTRHSPWLLPKCHQDTPSGERGVC